jgi:hypothetical protein
MAPARSAMGARRHVVRHRSAEAWISCLGEVADLLRRVEASDSADLKTSVTQILLTVSKWLAVEAVSVLIYDGVKERIDFLAAVGVNETNISESHRLGVHLTGAAFQTPGGIFVQDLQHDPRCDRAQLNTWRSRLPSGRLVNAAFIPFSTEYECRAPERPPRLEWAS